MLKWMSTAGNRPNLDGPGPTNHDAAGHPDLTVIIPAFNERAAIADTVRATRSLMADTQVIVVDDGSHDDTARLAAAAGAEVIKLAANKGKAQAVRTALAKARAAILLLIDADTGASAVHAGVLLDAVLYDDIDMAIARLPAQSGSGGFGLVVGTARWAIARMTGVRLQQPLSGQRALRRSVLERLDYWGWGFGLEVAMTTGALSAGCKIREVPTQLQHAATGMDAAGIRHRGRQFFQVAVTLGRLGCSRLRRQIIAVTRQPLL